MKRLLTLVVWCGAAIFLLSMGHVVSILMAGIILGAVATWWSQPTLDLTFGEVELTASGWHRIDDKWFHSDDAITNGKTVVEALLLEWNRAERLAYRRILEHIQATGVTLRVEDGKVWIDQRELRIDDMPMHVRKAA